MPIVPLNHSPLAGGATTIYYRQYGSGTPLVFLHGGWGYEAYPLSDAQRHIPGVQVLIPDRAGYGKSSKQAIWSVDFHQRAAEEMLAFLEALGIAHAIVWGHSDGAVIAAWMGLKAPQRCRALILESLHYLRVKPRSREFFSTLARNPDVLGPTLKAILARDHGEEHWRDVIRGDSKAWEEIAAADVAHPDLFEGRLAELRMPVALIHGELDPRTEPGELEAVQSELPAASLYEIPGAQHCPHADKVEVCDRVVREIVEKPEPRMKADAR